MYSYEYYEKIYNNLESFGSILTSGDKEHYKDMFEKFRGYKEKEEAGDTLTSEELVGRATVQGDLDSFINQCLKSKKDEIDEKINKLLELEGKILEHFHVIESQLILTSEMRDITEYVYGLQEALTLFIHDGEPLTADIEAYKSLLGNMSVVDLTLNYKSIKTKIEEFKVRFKKLKEDQVFKYNARVEQTNKIIFELKTKTSGLSQELIDMIGELTEIPTNSYVNIGSIDYRNLKYLEQFNYQMLIQINIKISIIQKRLNQEEKNNELINGLESIISKIEKELEEIAEVIDELSKRNITTKEEYDKFVNDFTILRERLSSVSSRIVQFGITLGNNKTALTEEQYNSFLERTIRASNTVNELDEKMDLLKGRTFRVPEEKSEYQKYVEKLSMLKREVTTFSNWVDSIFGNIFIDAKENSLVRPYETYKHRLEDLSKAIEDEYNKGEQSKLNKDQYEQLKKIIQEIEKVLVSTKEKIENPEMYKGIKDIFEYINGSLDGIDTALTELENRVKELPDPIKDKNTRKEIEKLIAQLEQEIIDNEKLAEKYKDENPEKYEETMERIKGLKDRLNKVGVNYRKKCPLGVKAVRTAKNFYKKHKKLCLVVAGLAAMALVHATVGPVIIPAIMHGNMMIGFNAPALRGFTVFVNNILGGMINANVVNNLWVLANGAIINPAIASASLLKGLAISGLGSAAILAPMAAGVVVGIKKLMEKIKKSDKKIDLGESIKKVREKAKKSKEEKKKQKNINLSELYLEFLEQLENEDGKTFEEFCEANNLTDEQIEQITEIHKRHKGRSNS